MNRNSKLPKESFDKDSKQKTRKGSRNRKPNNKHNYKEDYNTQEASNSKDPLYINDLGWYVNNKQILDDVCRLPYNIPVGMPFNREGVFTQSLVQQYAREAVPGIAVMNIVPTIGNGRTATDPVNLAFNGMFTYIRARNSGRWDFDANDLAIAVLATDSLYYTVHWYKRIYGTLALNHQSNRYLPKALLEAQGIDYENLMNNSDRFRAAINLRLERINSLKIPSGLHLFKRHEWLFDNYYIEGPSEKDQIYMYKPAAYYVYGLSEAGPSELTCHRFLAGATGTDGRLTWEDLIRKLDAMMNPIFDDEDVNLISGYIEKAYEGKVMQLELIPDDYRVNLIWSDDVLLQFKNAKPWPIRHAASGSGYYDRAFDITQAQNSDTDIRLHIDVHMTRNAMAVYRDISNDTAVDVSYNSEDKIKYNFLACLNEWSKSIMLTSPRASVEPGENMINTRLVPAITPFPTSDDWKWGYSQLSFASEWPISVEYFYRYREGVSAAAPILTRSYEVHRVMFADETLDTPQLSDALTRFLAKRSVFKYAPEMSIVTRIGSDVGDVLECANAFFDVDNYTLVNSESIHMIHDAACLGMLRVPEVSSTAI